MTATIPAIKNRFRGYLPVIIDIETGGFNAQTDALLEIAAVTIAMDEKGLIHIDEILHFHVTPFPGANMNPNSLIFNKIDPHHPFRGAISEVEALAQIFKAIKNQLKQHDCQRAILTGHNPAFDLNFLNAAVVRCELKRNPFHPFSCLDTASLAALAVGQTVLAKAVSAIDLEFDHEQAHSARYDAIQTAELFCAIVNKWQTLGGWDATTQQSVFAENLSNENSAD